MSLFALLKAVTKRGEKTMKPEIIKDADFEKEMEEKVEPFLLQNVKDGFFSSFDETKIHYEAYINENAKAAVVLFHGFTESCEKFHETVFYFFTAGYSVFSFDLRGHGYSGGKLKENRFATDVSSFDDYAKDTQCFVEKIVRRSNPKIPLFAFSHSLGGTALLLYMTKSKNAFEKAVLSSPMICPNTEMPVALARAAAGLICKIGKGKTPVPGRCVFDRNESFENGDTTSRERFLYYHKKRVAKPELQLSGPVFHWVLQSLRAKDDIMKNASRIETPILIFKPESDRQVLEAFQDDFARKLKNVRVEPVKGSKHEIFQSKSNVLQKYYETIFSFFEDDTETE